MQRCPGILKVMSWAFVLIAVSFPVQIAARYGQSWSELFDILDKLTWLNWMAIGGLVTCAALVGKASPHTTKAIPALIALIALNNLMVGYFNTDYSFFATNMATLAFVFLTHRCYTRGFVCCCNILNGAGGLRLLANA